ncbi:MAG: amidohydrolase family protein [Acetobacteraceae bacterium]
MPDFPIVDSHVHLYDTARFSYPWLKGVPAIAKSHLPADYDRASGAFAIERIVFAEVDVADGQNIAEARFVAELAARDARIQGIIACAHLERGEAVAEELDTLARIGRVRAIRRLIQTQPDPEFCLRPDFIAGVRLLARYAWPFDICVLHHQLPQVIELVRRCPEVHFVLDHIGKPGIKAGLVEPWQSRITELAHLPNVVCKISGVATEADHTSWSRAELRPYIEHCISSFGFGRVMFGSDWPVLELAGTYADWVGTVDWIVSAATEHEKRELFHDTAVRVYRLPP